MPGALDDRGAAARDGRKEGHPPRAPSPVDASEEGLDVARRLACPPGRSEARSEPHPRSRTTTSREEVVSAGRPGEGEIA